MAQSIPRRQFDFYDVGTQVGQDLAAVRPDAAAEIEYPGACEGANRFGVR
jgi:hypothetical protein